MIPSGAIVTVAFLGLCVFLIILAVYVGGYRRARQEALIERYRAAEARFLDLRTSIRTQHTLEVHKLRAELDIYLERLGEIRREALQEGGGGLPGADSNEPEPGAVDEDDDWVSAEARIRAQLRNLKDSEVRPELEVVQ